MQHQDHFFKETNTLTMKETISLAHFLEFQMSESEQPIIEFYETKEDRCITTFVLFLFPRGDLLDFNCEIDAVLMYFSGNKWYRTNLETREQFAKDHPYFEYCWFDFD